MGRIVAAAALLLLWALPAAAAAQEPGQDENANKARSTQRATEHQAPAYQAELRARYAENAGQALSAQANDPERNFLTDACWHGTLACAGDVRLYDFQERGRGLVEPVLWTARNGSTVSGHVWMTKHGPAKRPAVVITNGSIQAPEELYWYAAQTLARAGYVVVTWDPQMQGKSDTFGEGDDALEGFPSQTTGNTFYDWTQDAIDFLLSTPDKPFCPRPSRSGTSHCAKQQRRVGERSNAAHNPFHAAVDPERIGLAGHSYGAAGVSWMGQSDRRVDAVVAWDNLCAATRDATDPCLGGGLGEPPGLRVPSLGLSGDYFFGLESSEDEPGSRAAASKAFSAAGVDTGSITIRGGTHFEFSYLPSTSFRATLRGIDLVAWYTTAWLDKYVKGGDPTADARLLTTRWRSDPIDATLDPPGKGNMYSYKYRSRLDVTLDGGRRFTCEDLRTGCDGQVDGARDGGPAGPYSFLALATAKDEPQPGPPASANKPRGGRSCTSRRVIRLTVRKVPGLHIRTVTARVGRRVVGRATRSRRVTVRLTGLPKGRHVVRLRIAGRRGGRAVTVAQSRVFRACA